MLVGARRTRFRIGIVRATLELCALGAGIALGGTFGVGTVLFALLVGPIVEASFAVLARTPLADAVARSGSGRDRRVGKKSRGSGRLVQNRTASA